MKLIKNLFVLHTTKKLNLLNNIINYLHEIKGVTKQTTYISMYKLYERLSIFSLPHLSTYLHERFTTITNHSTKHVCYTLNV